MEGRVVVTYLDFGNEEMLNISELFELPADLLMVPALAVCVKVKGVEKDKLEALLDEENISVVVEHGTGTFVKKGCNVSAATYLKQTTALPTPIVLPLNRHIEGEVSYVCSTGVVWFTPSTLAPLRDRLMDQLALHSPSPLPRLQVDQVCTTRFSLDG